MDAQRKITHRGTHQCRGTTDPEAHSNGSTLLNASRTARRLLARRHSRLHALSRACRFKSTGLVACIPGGMSSNRTRRLPAWYTSPARWGGSWGLGAIGRQRLATSSTRRTSSSKR
eukprot:scaffold19329_cov21-Tisochrysis_lutea.AAC.1